MLDTPPRPVPEISTASDDVYRIVGSQIESPLVIDVSRSGRRYPPEFQTPASFDILHPKISPYVERIVLPSVAQGATVLIAEFPPTYVDPNRPIDDIDPAILDGDWPFPMNPLKASLQTGTGLIHTLGSNYQPLYAGKISASHLSRRISNYYVPYHETLAALLDSRRQRFRSAYQLSCHSMSSIGPRDRLPRPHVCLGDLDGACASPDYLEVVSCAFKEAGLDVTVNTPFRGNELLRRHSAPSEGIFSLQIEIRRDLYLDESTRELHSGLFLLQDCLAKITATIRQMA